jgi:GLPGLI family protein
MKHTLIFFLIVQFAFSQSAKIEYDIVVKNDLNSSNKDIQNRFNNQVEIAKKFQYQLLINNELSSFKFKEKLSENNEDFETKIAKTLFAISGDIFTNLTEKKIITVETDGQITFINFSNYKWEISNESKTIDNIVCYKANLTFNLIGRTGKSIVQIIEAWFAPSIPYAFGPKNYCGLPGLILELTENRTTYIARVIDLDTKDIKINFPKGNAIEKVKYLEKLKENMKM